MVVDKRQMSHILSKYLNNYTIKAQIRKYLLGCKIAIESRGAAGGGRRQPWQWQWQYSQEVAGERQEVLLART